MADLDELKNWSAVQMASIHTMSWKSLCEAFNHTGQRIALLFVELADLKAEDKDHELIDSTVVVVNALAFYQAWLAKLMIAKHPEKVANIIRVNAPNERNPMTVMCKDGRWLPADLASIHGMDQQQAEVANFLATISEHEHGLFVTTAAKMYAQLSSTYDSLGPIGKAVDTVIFPFNDAEDIDRLSVIVKIAMVTLNKSFEERWPELMPA